MRVFCQEHKKGFLAPRQTPIRCENKGHVLGELDFGGEAKPPAEPQWQYCCNCEHFCAFDFDQNSLESCPVCTRRSSTSYVCDRCYTITFESNTPLQTKNFTLTSEGVPQPSCPGCLQATSADLHEHTCDALGASFITALNSCPICRERLDVEPAFPSSIADYLRRTKAANKVNATFDYESELFLPVEDGEFVIIGNGTEAVQPIVLPRSPRFTARRIFYEFYQDYYHCANPDAGEVHIVQPAAVVRVGEGWRLQSTGILEVVQDQPKKKQALPTVKTKEESPVVACAHCGSLIEEKYAFCWQCGDPLRSKEESSETHWQEPAAMIPAAAMATDDEESTVQRDRRPMSSSIFSWATEKETKQSNSANRSILKLIAIIVAGLMLLSLGLFALTRSASTMPAATVAQVTTPNLQSDPSPTPRQEAKRNAEPASQKTPAARPEEDELKRLRAKRIAASPSDRQTILKAFAKTEKQYPNDYRFPYERAKLAIKGPQTPARDEALNALSVAAQKAIKTGKANEMLDGLEADKAGDFQALAHRRHEWTQLLEALKRKDMSLLSEK